MSPFTQLAPSFEPLPGHGNGTLPHDQFTHHQAPTTVGQIHHRPRSRPGGERRRPGAASRADHRPGTGCDLVDGCGFSLRRDDLRDAPTRSVVLRHAGRITRLHRLRLDAPTSPGRLRRLRRPHPADPGLDRPAASPAAPPRRASQEGHPRGGHLGRALHARSTALQRRRLQLRRSGRDGQSPHQPLRLRHRGPGLHAVQQHAGLGVDEHAVSLRPHLLGLRWSLDGCIGPQDPARHHVAPPA